MKAYFITLLEQMGKAVLATGDHHTPENRDKIIAMIEQYVMELKAWMLSHEFESLTEEVEVFKYHAPEIFAALIYYRKLKTLHNRMNAINRSMQKKYLRRELKKINFFFTTNHELFIYYTKELNDRDQSLFIRNVNDNMYVTDDYAFLMDHRFCPLATYKIAKMKAYQKLEADIINCLKNKETSLLTQQPDQANVHWTASKSAATELVYGLFASGVFNSGQAKLKEIIAVFERSFHLSLDGYHRSYQDLKMRKKSRTSFLSDLRTQLENKMDEEE